MVNYKARLNPARVGAKTKLTSSQAITAGSTFDVDWDDIIYDTDNFWSATNPERLTIPIKGKYIVGYAVDWQGNASGGRFHTLNKNVSDFLCGAYRPNASGSAVEAQSVIAKLIVGDYIDLSVKHTSTTDPLNLDATQITSLYANLLEYND